jgi:hypothetical protein
VARWNARATTTAVFAATLAQLAVGALAPGLPQFDGKGFGARLVRYPVMMLLLPGLWWLRAHRREPQPDPPWAAFALTMSPFLVDVAGNTLDIYDTIVWWDDANHFLNWFLLCLGLGLLIRRAGVGPPWALGVLVTGLGATLAIVWELGEWLTFIRFGTELAPPRRPFLSTDVGIRRVEIRAAADNTRSRAVAERLGLTYEGILRRGLAIGDTVHDITLYAAV